MAKKEFFLKKKASSPSSEQATKASDAPKKDMTNDEITKMAESMGAKVIRPGEVGDYVKNMKDKKEL